jgi:hypothetical protein
VSALTFTTKIANRGADGWRQGSRLCFDKPKALEAALAVLLAKCEEKCAGYVSVRLDAPHRPLSTGPRSQNHRLNGFVSQFCNATGNDFEDIKLFVKRRAMRRGLPAKSSAGGKVVYSKVDGEPLPISEADMSVEQCGWVIAEIEQLAAEEGVTLVETSD